MDNLKEPDKRRLKKRLKNTKRQKIYIRGAYNKFPDFFRLGTVIDSTHMKL